jgi:hypothetical protein
MVLIEIGSGVDWIHQTENKDQWRTLMSHWVP